MKIQSVFLQTPSFDKQLFNLNNYMSLSPKQPQNYFSKQLDLKSYSRGMGALGLPGDLSSMSRFVRVAFTKMNGQQKIMKEIVLTNFSIF